MVLSLAMVAPRLLEMGPTLLTAPPGVGVSLALFLVGGFGLGRDIWLERSLAHAEARVDVLAREAERAQLLALRTHLDPHFLFNTLNAIAEWCRADGEVAERAVVQLSAMLRTVLAGVQVASWPLTEELALLDTLFALHRLRDPNRFQLHKRIAAPAPAIAVPPMLLLPLAENAVKHGPAAGHAGPIELEIDVVTAGRLRIALRNPGPFRGRRAGGHGLAIVERRLALAYAAEATFTIAEAGGTTIAEVTLPAVAPPDGAPT